MAGISRREALTGAAALVGAISSGAMAMPEVVEAEAAAGLKFELYKDNGAAFRWRLKAANGRVVATSGDGYKAKADCRNAIDLIRGGAATATVVEISA